MIAAGQVTARRPRRTVNEAAALRHFADGRPIGVGAWVWAWQARHVILPIGARSAGSSIILGRLAHGFVAIAEPLDQLLGEGVRVRVRGRQLTPLPGQLLAKLDELGVADNTIVVFTTDNGAEVLSWPDGGATPFRSEKDTNWEGGWRIPCVMRWPGVIEPGWVINDICSLQDFIPTFAAANGEADLVEKVKEGYQIGDKHSKFISTASI